MSLVRPLAVAMAVPLNITLPGTPQYSLGRSLVLHLLPGALTTVIYIGLVPLITRAGLPPLLALLIATLVGFVPIELGHLFLEGKRLSGRWFLESVVLYNQCGTWRRYALLVPVIVLLSIVAYIIAAPLDRIWGGALFSWLPSWYTYSDLSSYSRFSRTTLLVTFFLRLVVDGLIAPVTDSRHGFPFWSLRCRQKALPWLVFFSLGRGLNM